MLSLLCCALDAISRSRSVGGRDGLRIGGRMGALWNVI